LVAIQPIDRFLLRVNGTDNKFIVLLDVSPLAFSVHPYHRIMGLACRLRLSGKEFDLHLLSYPLLLEVDVEHPLGFIRGRWTAVRAGRYSHKNSPSLKRVEIGRAHV